MQAIRNRHDLLAMYHNEHMLDACMASESERRELGANERAAPAGGRGPLAFRLSQALMR